VGALADNFRFVVQDEKYNYVSARFPADAELLAEKTIALVKNTMAEGESTKAA
jgi:hypothetical protein